MRGHTLIEVLLVLTLMGATAATLAPTARRLGDRAAVVGAREALVGLLAEARAAAMATGGASVRIAGPPWTAAVLVADSTRRTVGLGSEFEVALSLNGEAAAVELEFDGLGLGRLAGQTIQVRRGEAVTELIVSSYGRVRRR